MKITNVSCTQFAGVRDRSISLTDGINVICGKNESGKSTLVNLISRTLFQNAKLDRRSDKEFYELYFPAAKKHGTPGDFADGKITLQTENGTYVLTKEWGEEPRCMLSTPDGVIRDPSKIADILKEALQYGEGVYSDLLFPSQRNAAASLRTVLDAAQKTATKQEIVDAVSQAFAESDGVSVDAVEQAIEAKIEEIAGKHWDFDTQAPVRRNTRWSNGLGEILKAYYAMEDAKAVLEEISRLERESDRAVEEYAARDAEAAKAEETYDRFHGFASRLAVQSERRKNVDRMEKELQKISQVLNSWPKHSEQLKKAKALQTEKESRALLDQYEAANVLQEEIRALDAECANRAYPDDAEVTRVRSLQRAAAALENKLCGINIQAAIDLFGDNRVEIKSLRTGEPVTLAGGIAAITEAVRISVPGVMQMQLSPADVDAASVEAQLAEHRSALAEIFAQYGAETLEELELLAKTGEDTNRKLELAKSRLAMLFGGAAFGELEEAAKTITLPVRSKEEIAEDLFGICNTADAAGFIAAKEAILNGFAEEYGSMDALKIKAFDLDAELKKGKEAVSGGEDIPAEYLGISDPEEHLELLQSTLRLRQSRREDALTAKTAAASRLESYKETVSGEPDAEAEKTEREFEEKKALLSHWLHIRDVFREQKQALHADPMQGIADRFSHYLGVISGGVVSSEFPDGDKLNMLLYSGDRLLDYGKLSEGTKDTVYLAFRLAVLDHLFPDGGGVIVFDDPFTDMDAERTAQACMLVKDCAARHQVIFLTCSEAYVDVLNGNTVLF